MNKAFLRSELRERTRLNKCPFAVSNYSPMPYMSVSGVWLSGLLGELDSCRTDVSNILPALLNASRYPNVSQVRFELSRVPVWYQLRAYSVLSANKMSKILKNGIRCVSGETYEVGSPECPPDILPASVGKNAYRQGRCVQCFDPVDLARELGIEMVKCWDTSDSLVDWICDFTKTEGLRSDPRLSVEEIGEDDVCYRLSSHATALSPSHKDLEGMSSRDRLYAFIVKNAPVSTADLVSGQFANRRQTFNLIRQLERNDKIERIKHGVYIAL